jgi:cytochrome c
MKKIVVVLFAGIFLSSCGGNGNKGKNSVNATEDLSNNPDYQKGLSLVAKNQCLTCHNVDAAVTGPPYREVAKKYANMPDTIVAHLAKKIISGGSGVWGEIFMTPHPAISQEDAEAMVKYILLLKK